MVEFARTPPTAAPRRLADDAARVERAARSRLDAQVAELFVPQADLLDERRRSVATQLLDAVLEVIEDDLRLRLAERIDDAGLRGSLVSRQVPIARPLLDRAGLLRDAELIAALLRRADEARIAERAARDPGVGGDPLLDLLASSSEAIAGGAMAVLSSEARRRDPAERPSLGTSDLDAELHHRLTWRVAAALRAYLAAQRAVAPALVDELVAEAATAALAGYDEAETLEVRAARLARALAAAEALDDDLLVGCAEAGHPIVTAAGLAARAGLPIGSAWDMLLDPDGARAGLLLRAAGVERAPAARLLLAFAVDDQVVAGIAAFEEADAAGASSGLALWRLDPDYRRSVALLAERRRAR